jgi:hypothetical protein
MGIWKELKDAFFSKKKEEPLKGLEEFPPLNIQKMNENIDPQLFQEGRTPSKSNNDESQKA